ncbi:MAG: elongation factor P [Candidatus Phytoplasma pruni]|uniref:elongation factor P n=1 Tax=Poinsettia branch-inducing phytoplasma TaxID=138647 RepID=UPI00037E4155|nr:elongation factor P [Poinsettia branch-inducing phytoplasma]WEK82719.1 MAG: elongation factor P [Candidatus Phytoplasma pruni]
MISTNDFKTGQTIKLNNHIYQVIEFLHVKPGKGAAFVRSKLKNLRTGGIIEHTFNSGIKVETALIDKRKLKFSYIYYEKYVFIDETTYEQIEIPKKTLKGAVKYLAEEMVVEVVFCDEKEILGVFLPDKISLKVVQTDPGAVGDTNKKTTTYKDAVLETGLKVKVPIFIAQDETIIVNTETGQYVSRDTSK